MRLQRSGFWFWTALALAAGLALRLCFIHYIARVAGDSIVYGSIARNWMQHGIYGFNELNGIPQPTLIRLPGYPLFLIVCFRIFGIEQYTAIMYVQVVIDLASCLLIAALADRLFGPRARMIALWLAALCPFTASYVAAPLTETLTLATIVLAFYALYRWQQAGPTFNRWLWILTGTLSYSILLRPEQGLLAAAIVPAMLWIAIRPRTTNLIHATIPVVVASLCILLPLIPWTIRNERTFHVFQPLAPHYATDPGEPVPLGFQRWYRTWAIDFASTEDIYWNYDGAPIQISDLPDRAFDSDTQYTRTAALLDDYNRTTTPSATLDDRFAALASERIANDPIRYYLFLPVARVLNMALRPRVEMFPTPLQWWKYHEDPRQTIFSAAYATLNLAYFALAAIGIALWRRRHWTGNAPIAWALFASILLRTAVLLTLDNSEPRYTLEFFPVIFLLAAIPFTHNSKNSPVEHQKQLSS
ncbi:ArnT family glycosyltransferase [Granulicella arctica]|uniref:Glycosyltransferase RgtA/B/C/D-like domain-containing protein n=1 Tax=Granulicella arctica TaxID=940613 RepID=A0A7Y9PI10_9BACT|nr:glycosyltransferase family 39 protein [Granulicella arctica]NYF80100.1 hypothetical protein [Granulicella arctica]